MRLPALENKYTVPSVHPTAAQLPLPATAHPHAGMRSCHSRWSRRRTRMSVNWEGGSRCTGKLSCRLTGCPSFWYRKCVSGRWGCRGLAAASSSSSVWTADDSVPLLR